MNKKRLDFSRRFLLVYLHIESNTLKITCFFFILCLQIGFSQSIWQPVPNLFTNPDGQRFDDVFFLNENIGWAANGANATIHKTIDGGLIWTEQLNQAVLGASYYFRNIEFLNANIGFLGTLNGDFFKTTDGGDTWNVITNITQNLSAICGITTVDDSFVYACGAYFGPAHIIKSIDSGNTWQFIDMSVYANALVELKFANEALGYAAGRSDTGAIVLKTTDGGTTWTEIYNSNIQGEYIWKLQFIDSDTNVIYGSLYATDPNKGKLIKTFDAGATWTSLDAPESEVQAVGFISQNRGWMGGHNTGFYETNDGGLTWIDLSVGSNLNRIFILSDTRAFASGATIYKFTDEALSSQDFEESFRKELEINLTTNPVGTNLELTIEFIKADNLMIELYDVTGLFIKQLKNDSINKSGKKTYTFNISNLSSGTYILDFHSNTGRESKKFIKR